MKIPVAIVTAFCLVTLEAQLSNCFAQATSFTYQGRLNSGSSPFNGSAEFQPTLWDAATGGTQFPNNPATVIVSVTNGLFVLPLDFGSVPFNAGAERWLQLQVRTTIGPFTTLNPRQRLTATPYALHSANAATATTATTAQSVAAGNITGILSLAQLPGLVVTNNQAGVNLAGAFAGNGGGLTNLLASSLVLSTTNVSVTAWGHNEYGQSTVPPDLDNSLAVSPGIFHSVALKADRTVFAWGDTNFNQTSVPVGLNNVAAISAGYVHSLALKSDGTVVAWGSNAFGTLNVPAGLNNVAAVSAGVFHNAALKTDRTVVVWGTNNFGQATVPPGVNNLLAVAAGGVHVVALRMDGTVVAWGGGQTNEPGGGPQGGNFGQAIVPAGLSNVVAISAGYVHSLALKSDGTVVAWGAGAAPDPTNSSGVQYGQSMVPAGLSNVVAISAAFLHSLALKADGTVVAWGDTRYGQADVPPGLNNVVALGHGAAAAHVLLLRKRFTGPVAVLDSDNTFNGNIQVNGDLRVVGDIQMAGNGGFRLNDGNLWLRSGTDQHNALGWYGGDKRYGTSFDTPPEGPVLFGVAGGALGTSDGTNGQKVALTWNNAGHVGIGTMTPGGRLSLGTDTANSKLLLYDAGSSSIGLGAQFGQMRLHLGSGGRFSFFDSPAGTEVMTISTFSGFGNVGIGTPSPTARLDVRGDIRMGSSGQYYAPGSGENLRIVRGVVRFDGVILAGAGFTVAKVGTGAYTVTFTPGFSDMPAVTATVQFGFARMVTTSSVSGSVAHFGTFDANGTAVDQWFHFIAVGAR